LHHQVGSFSSHSVPHTEHRHWVVAVLIFCRSDKARPSRSYSIGIWPSSVTLVMPAANRHSLGVFRGQSGGLCGDPRDVWADAATVTNGMAATIRKASRRFIPQSTDGRPRQSTASEHTPGLPSDPA
jgi:hypothetical protein